MRIPYLSDIIDARKEQNSILKDRIALEKDLLKARQEATKSIMGMTTIERSLSDELYGNEGSGYKVGAWSLPIDQMRRMSRIAYWDSSFARSIIDRYVQIVVGKGLTIESQPAWSMIPGSYSQEERQRIIEQIETRFRTWSRSKKVHYTEEFNLDRIINQAFFYYLYDGEFFVIFRYRSNGRSSRNPLTLEFVAPENIKATTSQPLPGNRISEGIEYDQRGVAVAYHVHNPTSGKSTSIPKYSQQSGRLLVYHNYNKKNERQRRGVPLLAGEISEITQLADYQNLEIQAAKINALFAIWIEPPENQDGRETISSGARKKSTTGIDTQTGETYTSKIENMGINDGGLIIDQLPAGHKVQSFDTKRPNVNFETFTNPVKRNIAAGAGLALSLADYNYSQQYSSARGENIIQWYKVDEYRDHVPGDLLNTIFRMYLWGEVDAGKIPMRGFDDDEIRDAWCQTATKGHTLPDIDPEKSMKANKMEIDEGIKHRQAIAMQRGGGNVVDNIARLKSENDSLADAFRDWMEVQKTTYSNSKSETVTESTSTTKTTGN